MNEAREQESVEGAVQRGPGATTIAPEVLVTISRLAALSQPGIARMASARPRMNRLFDPGAGDGVRIELQNGRVSVQLYLVVEHDVNVRQVSRKVQDEVARAIEHMVGMTVERVDVQIEDVEYADLAEGD